jgi:hypothetical protein
MVMTLAISDIGFGAIKLEHPANNRVVANPVAPRKVFISMVYV